MQLEIYHVNSFTSLGLEGNPAGVCITEHALEDQVMLEIAARIAFSETAFLSLDDLRLRWFTAKVEVNLCGHATLATAHVLREKGLLSADEAIIFNTLSGKLKVKVEAQQIIMDFPTANIDFTTPIDRDLIEYLGIDSSDVCCFGTFATKHFIEVSNEQQLLNLKPDFEKLKHLSARGVVVTAKSDSSKVDFVSRYFAPWVGVNEDPVTGSAHCALATFWGSRLNKTIMTGYQASQRGGVVKVEIVSSSCVKLIGEALSVVKKKITI